MNQTIATRPTVENHKVNWLFVVTGNYAMFKEWLHHVRKTDGVTKVTNTEFMYEGSLYKARFISEVHQMRGIDPLDARVIFTGGWERHVRIGEILRCVRSRGIETRHMDITGGW